LRFPQPEGVFPHQSSVDMITLADTNQSIALLIKYRCSFSRRLFRRQSTLSVCMPANLLFTRSRATKRPRDLCHSISSSRNCHQVSKCLWTNIACFGLFDDRIGHSQCHHGDDSLDGPALRFLSPQMSCREPAHSPSSMRRSCFEAERVYGETILQILIVILSDGRQSISGKTAYPLIAEGCRQLPQDFCDNAVPRVSLDPSLKLQSKQERLTVCMVYA